MLAFIRDRNSAASVVEIFAHLRSLLGNDTYAKLFPVLLTDNGGEFALDSVEVKVYRIGEGDGNWFNGTFKSDDVEVRLKKKE